MKRKIAPIETFIHTVRGEKVISASDLANIYGVPTKVLNQAVKRNQSRFPADFCFQLTKAEWKKGHNL
jgi:CTP synthase (UTP-ammonia lyase)